MSKRSKRWTEDEELQLIALYTKYKTSNGKFNISLIKDHERIGNRSINAMAAKLHGEYNIRSVGGKQRKSAANISSKSAIIRDYRAGMSIPNLVSKYKTDPSIIEFIVANQQNVVAAESRKTEKGYNFQRPRWSFDEDLQLLAALTKYCPDGIIRWVNFPKDFTINNRQFSAITKRWNNHLSHKVQYVDGKYQYTVQGVVDDLKPNAIKVVEEEGKGLQTPEPEVTPRQETPKTVTKSYLWGAFKVTKPA